MHFCVGVWAELQVFRPYWTIHSKVNETPTRTFFCYFRTAYLVQCYGGVALANIASDCFSRRRSARSARRSRCRKTLEARRAELNRLLADEWEYTLRTQPELATQVGDDRYNDRLSDFSGKAIADDLEHTRQSLARFEAIDVTGFPEQEKVNRALMLRSLHEALDGAPFKDWEMPATQFGGIHLGYASLAFDSPFRNVKDYEDYLSRLHQIPRVLEQAMAHMRDGLRDHLMPPKYLLEKVSSQAQGIADDSLEKSPFTEPLRKFPESISEGGPQTTARRNRRRGQE